MSGRKTGLSKNEKQKKTCTSPGSHGQVGDEKKKGDGSKPQKEVYLEGGGGTFLYKED